MPCSEDIDEVVPGGLPCNIRWCTARPTTVRELVSRTNDEGLRRMLIQTPESSGSITDSALCDGLDVGDERGACSGGDACKAADGP